MPGAPVRRLDRSIVEGPLAPAVWKIAWPTVLQNAIGGLQGIIDHAMVGHYVGFTGNAAIGVSWQIFLVVIVFISSLFTGMGVLVARFAGANQPDRVNRTVYQAFITAIFMSLAVMAPLGYYFSPTLLELVHATPAVRAEALPFLRTMFVYSLGMLLFFMLGGALRSAGDARTPLRLGIALTVMNVAFNVVLIPGYGPVPAFGTRGAAIGTSLASAIASTAAVWLLLSGRLVVHFPRSMSWRPDWTIIRSLFRFGLPAGVQGVAMNIAGVMLLRFIGSLEQSAEAQAAYAVGYAELFSLITWTSVGLMGAAAAVAGQNLGAGQPERAMRAVNLAARFGLCVAAVVSAMFLLIPEQLLAIFGLKDPDRRPARASAAAVPECFRLLHHCRPDVHRRAAGDRRHAKPALHHAGVAGGGADRLVPSSSRHGAPRSVGSVDRNSPRTFHQVRLVGRTLPTGQVATHRDRVIFTPGPGVRDCRGRICWKRAGAPLALLNGGAGHEMDLW